MYRPIILSKDCENLSKDLGITVLNRNLHGEKWPIIKLNGCTLDTSFSFHDNDKRWTDIAKKFSGDVLILGLGFGKAVLDACAKSSVKSVTVVELNEGVIDVFWLVHGKDFKGREKLIIENKDALTYKKTKFKHVFIDIFHNISKVGQYRTQTKQLRAMFKNSVIHQIPL